jgi:hypothetical protein
MLLFIIGSFISKGEHQQGRKNGSIDLPFNGNQLLVLSSFMSAVLHLLH